MPVRGVDFLEVAQICSQLDTEIGYRNTVARSYYAMYHQVIELLEVLPYPKEGVGCHSSLIQYLQNPSPDEKCDRTALKRLAMMLKAAKTNRVKADYRLDSHIFNKCLSDDSMAGAKRLFDLCEESKVA